MYVYNILIFLSMKRTRKLKSKVNTTIKHTHTALCFVQCSSSLSSEDNFHLAVLFLIEIPL